MSDYYIMPTIHIGEEDMNSSAKIVYINPQHHFHINETETHYWCYVSLFGTKNYRYIYVNKTTDVADKIEWFIEQHSGLECRNYLYSLIFAYGDVVSIDKMLNQVTADLKN